MSRLTENELSSTAPSVAECVSEAACRHNDERFLPEKTTQQQVAEQMYALCGELDPARSGGVHIDAATIAALTAERDSLQAAPEEAETAAAAAGCFSLYPAVVSRAQAQAY